MKVKMGKDGEKVERWFVGMLQDQSVRMQKNDRENSTKKDQTENENSKKKK